MKAADTHAKSDDELKAELMDFRKEAFNLRFQAASGQLENTARVRAVRRHIARVKTVLAARSAKTAAAAATTATAATAATAGGV